MSANVHKFKRWAVDKELDLNLPSSGVSNGGYEFALNQVTNFAELTALYDHYMITGIKIWFDYSPDDPGSVDPGLSPALFPKLWIKRDYDDSNTPTLNDMQQSNQTRCVRFHASRTTHSIYLRPAIAVEVYREGVTSASFQARRRWLDCAYDNVPHYGLKLVAQGLPSVNMGKITIRCRFDLLFKNVR